MNPTRAPELLDRFARFARHRLTRREVSAHELGPLALFFDRYGLATADAELIKLAKELAGYVEFATESMPLQSLATARAPLVSLVALAGMGRRLRRDHPWRLKVSEAVRATMARPGAYELMGGVLCWGVAARAMDWECPEVEEALRAHLREVEGLRAVVAHPPHDPWKGARPEAPPAVNLGVSHGMLGPFIYALRYGAADISAEMLPALLMAVAEADPLRFPSYWPRPDTAMGHHNLAWCYGSPMAGMGLLLYHAVRPGDPLAARARKEGLRLLEGGLFSPTYRPPAGMDAHVCHGRAGLALMALRASRLAGDSAGRPRAFELLGNLDDDPVLWVDPEQRHLLGGSWSLLNSPLGTAMVLLSLTAEDDGAWDRILLTS